MFGNENKITDAVDQAVTKKYCVSATRMETSISLVMEMTEEQFEFFLDATSIQFQFGDGLAVIFNRIDLDSFSIIPMQ